MIILRGFCLFSTLLAKKYDGGILSLLDFYHYINLKLCAARKFLWMCLKATDALFLTRVVGICKDFLVH